MRLFAVIIILTLFGCGQPKKKAEILKKRIDKKNQQGPVVKDSVSVKKRSYADKPGEDSRNLKTMLHDVLLYANKHKRETSFKKTLIWNFTSTAEAELTFGHLFSSRKQHLIVKSKLAETTVAVDVFLLEDSGFNRVYRQILKENTFVAYSLNDVNGDHIKDLLVNWYPSSGCCPRNIFYVNLYKPDGTLSNTYEFVNPTFSSSERTIRGLNYGHPGDAALYKYKWNGLKIDTIEFVLPDTVKRMYHVYYHRRDYDNPVAGKFIKSIPDEYHDITGYDWFNIHL